MASRSPTEEFDTATMMFQGLGWRSASTVQNDIMIKKSVFAMKVKNNIGFTLKGIGCAIKDCLPINKNEEYYLLTSSKAVSYADFTDSQKLTADRYCSQYPNHKAIHRFETSSLREYKAIGDFAFLLLGKNPDYFVVYDSSKLDSTLTAHGESLFAYTFVNRTFVQVKFEYNKESSLYERTDIFPPTVEDELSMEKLIGAPVIVDNGSECPLVVGVLGYFESQIIRPILFSEHPFEKRKSKQPQHNETIYSDDKHDTPANTPSESSSQESVSERDKVDSCSPSENKSSRQAGTIVGQDLIRSSGCHQVGSTNVGQNAMRSSGRHQVGTSVSQDEVNSAAKCFSGMKIKETKPVQEEAKVLLMNADEAYSTLFENVCIREKKITHLDKEMWKEVRIKLDPKRLDGDFESLAGKLGYGMEKIWFFGSQESPTCCLLKDWYPQKNKGTIKQLCTALRDIERQDVVDLIEEWIAKIGCCCELCGDIK